MVSWTIRTFLVIFLVATAGCTGLFGSETDVSTVTPAPIPGDETPDQVVTTTQTVTERETATGPLTEAQTGSLDPRHPRDVTLAFQRLTALLQTDGSQPTVSLADSPVQRGGVSIDVPDRFEATMGLGPAVAPETTIGTVENGGTSIRLVTANWSRSELDHNLAYLYARSLHEQRGWTGPLAGSSNGSIDSRALAYATHHGGATLGADTYAEAFTLNTTLYYQDWARAPGSEGWLSREAIRVGFEKYEQRDEFSPLYYHAFQYQPQTSEQFIHDLSPAYDPPRDLAVDSTVSDTWEVEARETLGELTLRAALATHLDRENALEATDNWGNDRLVTVSRGSDADSPGGFVLVTAWDKPSSAEGFYTGLRTYISQRAPETSETFRLRMLDEQRVVLIAGDESFVSATTIRTESKTIDVDIGP
ncbi:hypothetical protein [Halorhabdus salina]|uniref:hypothetical protein n=1 Tax=Halorhabdus salina TaxID=2750670 RepID=UPI0015EF797A|nr:hypothetical protein [Halorhabdus salina]